MPRKWQIDSDLSPAQLREQVTSPGGTTERALNTFQQENLEAIFRKAMTSAVARAEQMSEGLFRITNVNIRG